MPEKNTICQSCGMPLLTGDDFGTESDGRSNEFYCKYCYKDGRFTDPKVSVEEMAARCGAIISDMYGIPADKAGEFSLEQIKHLKRWSGQIIPLCGSCGMPLAEENDKGTLQDGSRSDKYCVYCYANGQFIEPDLTRDLMIKRCTPMIASQLSISSDNAEKMVSVYISSLPRWR
jgi:hypothetical protein